MTKAWAAHDAQTFRSFVSAITTATGKPVTELRILDLGCGGNAPMTILLRAAGCDVVGVDRSIGFRWGLGFRPSRYLQYARTAGVTRALRKVAGELVYDRVYYTHLAELTGLRLRDDADLRPMDIQNLTLRQGAYDVVHSNATWEHIADVGAANRALSKCLAPGGIAYIEIHLFPALSGGHDLPWIVPGKTVLGDVQPWRHLRDAQWQPPVFLNRLRESDYRREFERVPDLTIEKWDVEFTEGGEFVTPDVLRALPNYSAEELTKRSIVVVLRKH